MRIDRAKRSHDPGADRLLPTRPLPAFAPKGFSLEQAGRAITALLGPVCGAQGATFDFADLDLTMVQTNREIRFERAGAPGVEVVNPETGAPLAFHYGPEGQREHELLQLQRRLHKRLDFSDLRPIHSANRTYDDVVRTPIIDATFDALKSARAQGPHALFVVSNTGSEVALEGARDVARREGVPPRGVLSARLESTLGRLGLSGAQLDTGQKKALIIAATLEAARQQGALPAKVRFFEDKDSTLRTVLSALPELFPEVDFEIYDVVHRGARHHELVRVTDPVGYHSRDELYAPRGEYQRRVEAGLPPLDAPTRAEFPYPLIEGGTASFEPGAIVADPGDPTLFWVLSDAWDHQLYAYRLGDDGQLRREDVESRLSVRGGLERYEALCPMPDGTVLAATPFNRDSEVQRRVIQFRPGAGEVEPTILEHDFEALADEVERATGSRWFQVEGLCADADGRHVFFGIRKVGDGLPDDQNRDTVLIVRAPLERGRIGRPEASFELSTESAVGRIEGLADLQRDPTDGSYVVLTSHEGGDTSRLDNHGGHLFRIPGALLEGPAPKRTSPVALDAPLATLHAKGEGLALLEGGRALVVMDDDREWKDNFFGYDRNKAGYAVLDLRG